jgi:hypothetical protein
MPVSFDHCPNLDSRSHPEMAADDMRSVKSAIFVPPEDDASNGTLGSAAIAVSGDAVYVVSEMKTVLHRKGPDGLDFFIDVTFKGQFFRIILEHQPGKLWKQAVKILTLARKWIKGHHHLKRGPVELAKARRRFGFLHTVHTIANQPDNSDYYQTVETKEEDA